MKLISWNVNGLRACITKGFFDFLNETSPDILAVQETKMQPHQFDGDPGKYRIYWNSAEKKGYSGTAVFVKKEPLNVTYGIGIAEHDNEGRVITLEYETFFFVTVYTPNSQNELKRLDYRMTWEDAFLAYLRSLDAVKPVIVCGDLNVAHEEIDLKNPKTNRRNAGFTDEERACMTRLLENGFVDSFRHFYPDKTGAYSWWSYIGGARGRNAGWRIDYFIVSERLIGKVNDSLILSDVLGSDHCPVQIDTEELI
ncbi:MAG TPA: exodeoxyribonuclease III [Eubacteriales bacterium]|nr:exodeoxyribonuclease III [Eubacteriales bacterium]